MSSRIDFSLSKQFLVGSKIEERTLSPDRLIEPKSYWVLIFPTPEVLKVGSLLLPDQTGDHQKVHRHDGMIVAMGPNAFLKLQEEDRPVLGQRVLYQKYAECKPQIDGFDFVLVTDDEIMASIPEGVNVSSYIDPTLGGLA